MVRRTVKGHQFICHDNDIIPLLCYLSDKAIADYHGVTIERVATVRARHQLPDHPRRVWIPDVQNEEPVFGNNHASDALAAAGSDKLRQAIERSFAMFERIHGLLEGEGRILLMNTGLQPRRRAA